jgi:SAM-dependent methyltransferase
VQSDSIQSVLELGCGIGRYSRYLAKEGFAVTAVDFSKVAIEKARKKAVNDSVKPEFIVADVTNLEMIPGPFDVSFDVGCFHCLDADARQKYASEVYRLLKPGGTHLIWAMDSTPSGINLTPPVIIEIFGNQFTLNSKKTRRRIVKGHWYRLVRSSA